MGLIWIVGCKITASFGVDMLKRFYLLSCMVLFCTFSFCSFAYCAADWSTYADQTTGLKVLYPGGWSVTPNPEQDSLFKIGGASAGASFGEVKLSTSNDFLEPSKYLEVLEQVAFSQLPKYKKLNSNAITFGKRSQFKGMTTEVVFNTGDLPVHQQYVLFCKDNRSYALIFTSPEAGVVSMRPLFKQILANLDSSTTRTTAAHHATADAVQRWQLTSFHEDLVPIRFSYPLGWHVSREHHGDESSIKISGANAAGQPAEMQLSCTPRHNLSLEHFADTVEQEMMKPLPRYNRVNSETTSVAGTAALKQYSTFVADGMPAKQYAVFFVDRDNFHAVTLMSMTWSQTELRDLFQLISKSIQFH